MVVAYALVPDRYAGFALALEPAGVIVPLLPARLAGGPSHFDPASLRGRARRPEGRLPERAG